MIWFSVFLQVVICFLACSRIHTIIHTWICAPIAGWRRLTLPTLLFDVWTLCGRLDLNLTKMSNQGYFSLFCCSPDTLSHVVHSLAAIYPLSNFINELQKFQHTNRKRVQEDNAFSRLMETCKRAMRDILGHTTVGASPAQLTKHHRDSSLHTMWVGEEGW